MGTMEVQVVCFKDGVRGSQSVFNSTHLNARISLSIYDIKTYDTSQK